MSRHFRLAVLSSIAACATLIAVPITTTSADAKMSCVNVKKRFQVCGEVKPWTRFVAGVGVRFQKPKPTLASK